MARQQPAQQTQPAQHAEQMEALFRDAARKCALWLDGSAEPLAQRSFDSIEDHAVRVGDAVARAVMEQALEQQASETEFAVCRCGTPLEPLEPEPRDLLTRRGSVGWLEPLGHCPRCRRDFFPSVPNIGPAAG
jgi:hypothetical protein